MQRYRALVAVAALAASACDGAGAGQAGVSDSAPPIAERDDLHRRVQEIVKAKPAIDRTTPDRAVQSWWAMADWQEAFLDARFCGNEVPTLQDFHIPYREAVLEILGGSIERERSKGLNCERTAPDEQFSRSIVDVRMETPTRAVVEAQINNVTPVPDEVAMDALDLTEREYGQPTRYILSRDDAGWTIDQIFRDRPLYFDGNGEPQYPRGRPWGEYQEILPEGEDTSRSLFRYKRVDQY